MKRLYLFGTVPPRDPSVGDHAQTLAVQKFLAEHFRDYVRFRFSLDELKKFLKVPVDPDDLIFIQSGGSFGDLYPELHNTRKVIISRFPRNRIIQLPVSVHYDSAANFEADKIFFSDRPNLTILSRTRKAADLLKNNFGCRVEYFPDFVYYLDPPAPRERRGVLVVLRGDNETALKSGLDRLALEFRRPLKLLGKLTGKDVYYVAKVQARKATLRLARDWILKRVPGATVQDVQTHSGPISDADREKIVYGVLEKYAASRLVVTDRFHGLVFAAITGTPALALPTRIKGKMAASSQAPRKVFETFRDRFVDWPTPAEPPIQPRGLYDAPDRSFPATVFGRRSVRKWTADPVPYPKVKLMIDAARWSPTAANTQALIVWAINAPGLIARLCQLTSPWFKASFPPLILVFAYDTEKARKCGLSLDDWTERFIWQDTAAATMAATLTAEHVGLRTCWASTNPAQAKRIKEFIGWPKAWVLTNMLFVGYSRQKVSLGARHQGRPIRRGGP